MELDVRASIDLERDRLRIVEKNAARRIVTGAENNLMNLLKSKEAVNCLKVRNTSNPFRTYQVRNSQARFSLFDE